MTLRVNLAKSPWAVVALGMATMVVVLFAEDLGADALNELLLHLPGVDKGLHAAQSFVFFWALHALLGLTPLTGSARVIVAAGGTLSAAVFDEVQQRWMAGRTVEGADIVAGISGIALGCALLSTALRPRVATAVALCGVVMGSYVTYVSHLRTRDYNRGLLAARGGRMDEARSHYLRATESADDNPEVFNAAAWSIAEFGEGDAALAVSLAQRSLDLRPDNPDALDTYGWALYRAGRAADAVPPLEAALAAKPDIYCIHYHLAMVYLDLGRRDDARRHLRFQVAQMPRTREAAASADVLARMDAAPMDAR